MEDKINFKQRFFLEHLNRPTDDLDTRDKIEADLKAIGWAGLDHVHLVHHTG